MPLYFRQFLSLLVLVLQLVLPAFLQRLGQALPPAKRRRTGGGGDGGASESGSGKERASSASSFNICPARLWSTSDRVAPGISISPIEACVS